MSSLDHGRRNALSGRGGGAAEDVKVRSDLWKETVVRMDPGMNRLSLWKTESALI